MTAAVSSRAPLHQVEPSRLLRLLERRFQRLQAASEAWIATAGTGHHDQRRGRSLLSVLGGYCRLFREHSALEHLLEALEDQQAVRLADIQAEPAFEVLRDHARWAVALVAEHQTPFEEVGDPSIASMRALNDLVDAGDLSYREVERGMHEVAQASRALVAKGLLHASLAEQAEKRRVQAEAVGNQLLYWEQGLDLGAPFDGAAVVRELATMPAALVPTGGRAEVEARMAAVHNLNKAFEEGHPGQLMVLGADLQNWHQVIDALHLLHDHVVARLEEGLEDVELLLRFRHRAVFFCGDELRCIARLARRRKPRSTHADEDALRDYLGAWLLDAGRVALPEVKLDRARADGMLHDRTPVPLEVKVLRPHDTKSNVAARLRDGFTKATNYAAKTGSVHGHLVVFDMTERRRIDLSPPLQVGAVKVHVHHVALGASPTETSKKKAWNFTSDFANWARGLDGDDDD